MKENNKVEDDKNEFLLNNLENQPKAYRKTFPLGYQDNRERKYYGKRKSKLSKHSSKSGSSESIEEKNEELEDENFQYINKKNNNGNNNNILITDDNLKSHSLNEDSDSEIVEEEIISEEIIAQIYKNSEIFKEKINKDLGLNNNISTPIIPISESVIAKEVDNINKSEKENQIVEIKEKKEKIVKKKENILFKYFNHKSLIEKLRIITLIILIIYIVLTIFSIFIYAYNKNKKIIFCFEFFDKDDEENNEKFFLSHRNSFFIIQTLLIFTFISVINTLVRNEYLQVKHFFKDMSFHLPLTLLLNMPMFIVGIILDKYDDKNDPKILTPIFFSILTFIGVCFMGSVLINIKRHKYKSISSLINISILCSFLSAYECYCLIYCICFLVRSSFIKTKKSNVEEMSGPEIIAGLIYFAIGFFIITAFKDIFFSVIVVIVEIGLLYIRNNYSITVVCFNIMTTFFSFASIVVTIFKFKKRVFGLSHND